MRLGHSALVLACLAAAAPALAQATVPAKGEGTITLSVQDALVTHHLTSTSEVDAGSIVSRGLIADLDVGLGHGLAASVSLPYLFTKYDGDKPHVLGPGEDLLRP